MTLRMPERHYLFSFIGPMAMTKEAFLLQVRQYVPADEYVMVGNIQVSGQFGALVRRVEWAAHAT